MASRCRLSVVALLKVARNLSTVPLKARGSCSSTCARKVSVLH